MNVLYDRDNLTALFWSITVATPFVAAILVAAIPKFRTKRFFFPFTLTGPVVGILWVVFNWVCNLFGLDSLVGLLVNLLLFCVTGAALGLVYRMVFPKIERTVVVRTISLKPRSEMKPPDESGEASSNFQK